MYLFEIAWSQKTLDYSTGEKTHMSFCSKGFTSRKSFDRFVKRIMKSEDFVSIYEVSYRGVKCQLDTLDELIADIG